MNESNINVYKNSLIEKKKNLTEILEYTMSKNFEIEEDSVETISDYLNSRERMYLHILELEKKINLLKLDDFDENNTDYKDIFSINKENDKLIYKILELDEINKDKINSILKMLKENIKSIKQTDRANQTYFENYSSTLKGNLFDSTR